MQVNGGENRIQVNWKTVPCRLQSMILFYWSSCPSTFKKGGTKIIFISFISYHSEAQESSSHCLRKANTVDSR